MAMSLKIPYNQEIKKLQYYNFDNSKTNNSKISDNILDYSKANY